MNNISFREHHVFGSHNVKMIWKFLYEFPTNFSSQASCVHVRECVWGVGGDRVKISCRRSVFMCWGAWTCNKGSKYSLGTRKFRSKQRSPKCIQREKCGDQDNKPSLIYRSYWGPPCIFRKLKSGNADRHAQREQSTNHQIKITGHLLDPTFPSILKLKWDHPSSVTSHCQRTPATDRWN